MNKHLVRLIAFSLVPCLIAEPVCAVGLSFSAQNLTPFRSSPPEFFKTQALEAPSTQSGHPHTPGGVITSRVARLMRIGSARLAMAPAVVGPINSFEKAAELLPGGVAGAIAAP